MKRAVAIILSLTVIWLQVVAAAQTLSLPPFVSVPSECDCCVGAETFRCCCVTPAAPDTAPQPILPLSARAAIDFTAVLPQRIAWLLPPSPLGTVASSEFSSASLSAVPLFRRDCALLI
jgi:hypothetical protein